METFIPSDWLIARDLVSELRLWIPFYVVVSLHYITHQQHSHNGPANNSSLVRNRVRKRLCMHDLQ
jgi:hypothetical protein